MATSLAIFFGHQSAKKSADSYYDRKYIAWVWENQTKGPVFGLLQTVKQICVTWRLSYGSILVIEFRHNNHKLVSSLSFTPLSSFLTALKWEMFCAHRWEHFVQYALLLHSLCTHQHRRLFFLVPGTAGMGPAVQGTGKVKFKCSPTGLQHLPL